MKFSGVIGFSEGPVEVHPGYPEEVIVERKYYGDVIRATVHARNTDKSISDQEITNEFSIVIDGYALENFFSMRYLYWGGVCWEIKQVEFQRPRLIVRVGGVWNGETLEASEDSGDDHVVSESSETPR